MDVLSKPKRYATYAVLIAALLWTSLTVFWAFWPYNPLEVEYIQPLVVENGYKFTYKMRYDKKIALPAEIGKQFVNDVTISLPQVVGDVPAGKGCSIHEIRMPKLPPGEYYFRWFATYKVNPIREVTVVARTAKFEVR